MSFAQGAHHGLLAFQHLQLDEGIGLGCADLDCNALGHCHFNGVPVVRKVRLCEQVRRSVPQADEGNGVVFLI